MDNNQMRAEFVSIRRKYFKERPRLCGRCGNNKSVQLHHKIAMADGGSNDYSNLIPLCSLCHTEWHHALEGNLSFDEFLELPSVIEMAVFMRQNPVITLEDGEVLPLKMILQQAREFFRPFREIEYYDSLEKRKRKSS